MDTVQLLTKIVDFLNQVPALATLILTLAGLAALIAILVNVLKTVGVVKDGDAPAWVAGMQMVALVGFMVVRFVKPEFDLLAFDAQLGLAAQFLAKLLEFALALGLTKFIHDKALAGTPVVGKSFTDEELKKFIAEAKAEELAEADKAKPA